MAKKWWGNEPHIRSLRKRLRAGYRGSLELYKRYAEDDARALYERKLADEKAKLAVEREGLIQRAEQAEATAREVLRVRLEYGPRAYSTRFTLFAACDERWICNARNLSFHMHLIIDMLAHKLVNEFRQIDFSRVKPNRFEPDENHVNRYPVFYVEPGGNDRTS